MVLPWCQRNGDIRGDLRQKIVNKLRKQIGTARNRSSEDYHLPNSITSYSSPEYIMANSDYQLICLENPLLDIQGVGQVTNSSASCSPANRSQRRSYASAIRPKAQ